MRPNRSTAARTAASALARLVTSSLTASRSFDWPKALDTAALSRPEATTALPAARAALAKSTPMPRLAPVINQILLLLMTPPCPARPLLLGLFSTNTFQHGFWPDANPGLVGKLDKSSSRTSHGRLRVNQACELLPARPLTGRRSTSP